MFRTKLTALLLSTLLCGALFGGAYEAIVTSVNGTVLELNQQQQVVRTLSKNARVVEGNAIRTRPDSSATLVLANGAVITVTPDTTLVLEQMQLDGDASLASYRPLRPSAANTRTRLRLDRGEVLGEVKGIRANSKFEVASAVGTAGISGTKFTVAVTVSGNTYTMTISNLDGTVVSTLEGQSTVNIPAGQSVVLSGTFDDTTDEVSDATSTAPAAIPAATLNTLSSMISNAVKGSTATTEESGDDQLIIPINPVDPDLDPDGSNVSSDIPVVVGTPT